MKIREATGEDIDALLELRMEFLADMEPVPPETREMLQLQWRTYFGEHLGKDCIVFLADDGEKIGSAAFLLIQEKPANLHFPTGRTGLILNVYTRPGRRRLGGATLVLNALIAEARKRKLDLLELSATAEGADLYRGLGFRETEKHTEMRLPLNERTLS